jgi:hypothetical protein
MDLRSVLSRAGVPANDPSTLRTLEGLRFTETEECLRFVPSCDEALRILLRDWTIDSAPLSKAGIH